jgi:Raf kinase inhibitor-like YbhB/YbcL family protein
VAARNSCIVAAMRTTWCVLTLVVAGCGGGDSNPAVDGPPSGDGPGVDMPIDTPTVFALTSPTVTEGGTIPTEQTCDGANTSPALDWVAVPAGALSLAIVFTDKNNDLRHSAIYDIPISATGLPADVDKVFSPPDVPGAHQARNFSGGSGYAGPCPPINDGAHVYEQKLYALDVATLPGVNMATTAPQVETRILEHDLASVTLTASYDRN